MLKAQFELEAHLCSASSEKFKREMANAISNKTFGNTKTSITLISTVIEDFEKAIIGYIDNYSKGKAVRSTLAAEVITRFKNIEALTLVVARVVFNSLYTNPSAQVLYREIGQALEDEAKMQEFKRKNLQYYTKTINDLRLRGASSKRIKTVMNYLFAKQLEFQLESWGATEKIQVGMVLTNLLIESTGLIMLEDVYKKGKHHKIVVPTDELVKIMEDLNSKFEVLHPQFLPMVCEPKPWCGVFEGGYISPYFRRNKLIKNYSKEYLKMLQELEMPEVYSAINHLQQTSWQINSKVFDVAQALWAEGKEFAELPDREDKAIPPFPFPNLTDGDALSEEELEIKKAWKREAYSIHKENVQKRSLRILVAQILRIAEEYRAYEKVWFPYQMDFRGRLYPIPVLLQPQGSDLAKGLLQFAEGKSILGDDDALKWLQIHGANMFGADKCSYTERVAWVKSNEDEIVLFAQDPLVNRGWAEADKPFQFLAWCFEYAEFLKNPAEFRTHIPIQLDGTCNGLQHYSALLKDEISGSAVNLVDSDEPADIYSEVAEKLVDILKEIKNAKCNLGHVDCYDDEYIDNCTDNHDWILTSRWMELGINRKLTKRPVMVLPYGGSAYGCREFIADYLKENFSEDYLWKFFGVGKSPADCVFKVSLFLSKYLWSAIEETLSSAIRGMDYLKKVAAVVNAQGSYIQWVTPVGLPVRQDYKAQRKKMIRTELYGSLLKTTVKLDTEGIDKKRQLNGICPNFIHSLDAACLMIYLNKCKEAGINSVMSVHDCYATHATDTEKSAKLLRESFVEIYSQDVLGKFVSDIEKLLPEGAVELPKAPEGGSLKIEDVLHSKYFFN